MNVVIATTRTPASDDSGTETHIKGQWVTGYHRKQFGTSREWVKEISWSSVGAVTIDEARDFANRILLVCDQIEKAEK